MEKHAKKISENLITSSVFTFESYACSCEQTEIIENISSSPIPALKLTVDKKHPLNFAFGSKVGLVRLNEDGSIAESNILGKMVALDTSNPEECFHFFTANGFLFPIERDKSYTISVTDFQIIINRLHATLELMSTITDMSRTSYEKIIRMIFYHLFAPIVSLETTDGKYKYVSGRHQYASFLDKNKDAKREDRLFDTFNNSSFSFTDTMGSFELNADFVDSVLNGNPKDSRYENPLFQNVFTTYCSPREEKSKAMLLINDFVFHYFTEVGIIDYVDLKTSHYVADQIDKSRFTDELKAKAVLIAKNIIKSEIENNLRRVRPTYDINKLEPAWKMDSLLSALYFGLFYMRPNMETYRRCDNTKCGELFLVPVSSRKKKYCCTACMNRDMAARKRARDKLNATKSE